MCIVGIGKDPYKGTGDVKWRRTEANKGCVLASTFLGKLQNTQHLDDKVIEKAANEYEKLTNVGSSGRPHCQFHARSKLRILTRCLHYSQLHVDNRLAN